MKVSPAECHLPKDIMDLMFALDVDCDMTSYPNRYVQYRFTLNGYHWDWYPEDESFYSFKHGHIGAKNVRKLAEFKDALEVELLMRVARKGAGINLDV